METLGPPFGSDPFVQAIVTRARTSGKDQVALMLSPSQVEVVLYALRELMVLPEAEIKVPVGVPDRARELLETIAVTAQVRYQPVIGPTRDS